MTTTAPPLSTRCPADLVAGIRHAVVQHDDWRRTAEFVADEIRRHLPGPEILTAAERQGDPAGYTSHLLHVEPDGSFSVVALVWQPGQATSIHDHVAWGAFAVLQGTEYDEIFTVAADQAALVPLVTNQNKQGDVTGFAPPGDIHRITNPGGDVVIQLHVYGTDIARLGTSIRRIYDLPVRASG
jgi:predicted metal-dependent enzyme (double-stranded beta helix superfamily)